MKSSTSSILSLHLFATLPRMPVVARCIW